MRYIKLDDAIAELAKTRGVGRRAIDKLEAMETVEIIRCRDCKHYTSVTAHCEVRGRGLYLIRGMEDFCSRAERITHE
jgi:hypothetical protein